MTPEQERAHAAALEADRELARELGLSRPYTSPQMSGRCPGSAEYGHGMSLTTCHGACCAVWDAARAGRDAEREAG